ncbi:hypothetical protein cce_3611 [Crocosphaera subtropica ATCC 51142]|uniref:Uncharacterized protein n=1 Tax=Crocosphaera subtropica (strain ATCC 51142 / BH68) TaxID=43989 RepID=B1X0S0_CROS5|nr:hypothetical protein cce_3611 [Crocosphaera subtropica ATCC 51142]
MNLKEKIMLFVYPIEGRLITHILGLFGEIRSI